MFPDIRGSRLLQQHTFATLNAMRGIAAIAVSLMHVSLRYDLDFAHGAYLAVDFFFALSGFVIAHAYDSRLSGGTSPRRFILLRLARFYPLYVAGLLLVFLLLLSGGLMGVIPMIEQQTAVATAFGLLFLPTISGRGDALYPLNMPSWSLLMELLVNAAYAITHKLLTTRVLVAIWGLSAVLLGWCNFAYGSGAHGAHWSTVHVALVRAIFSFTVGVLICRHLGLVVRLGEKLPVWIAPMVLVGALFLPVAETVRAQYDLAFVVLVSPMLVALGAAREPTPGWIPLTSFLGVASFVLYALHIPAFWITGPVEKIVHLGQGVVEYAIIAALVVASPLINRFYDQPFRRWLVRIFRVSDRRVRTRLALQRER